MFDSASNVATGTPEQVAFQLLDFIRTYGNEIFISKNNVLDMYAECLVAVRGERAKR